MKIVLTADWHFGYKGRLQDQELAAYKLLDYCSDNNIKIIINLGDLSHDRESMTYDVSNTIIDILNKSKDMNIQFLSIVGNHDMFYRFKWKTSSVRPFSKSLTCLDYLYKLDIDGKIFWCIPFVEYENYYMKILMKINDLASENDILLTHIGIADAIMNLCFLFKNWNIVNMHDTKFNKVYTGHFHCTQNVGKCWYPGSLIPFNFDEGLTEHGFFVYDLDKNNHEFININSILGNNVIKDYISIDSNNIEEILNNCKDNNVRVFLNSEDDKEKIQKLILDYGASRIVLVKPKENTKKLEYTDNLSYGDMFSEWLKHDNPNLNHKLLLKLDKEIRSDTKVILDD